jgi:hypothetical protein
MSRITGLAQATDALQRAPVAQVVFLLQLRPSYRQLARLEFYALSHKCVQQVHIWLVYPEVIFFPVSAKGIEPRHAPGVWATSRLLWGPAGPLVKG